MEIRMLKIRDIEPALALAERVFMKCDAPDYTQEGIETFRRFIEPNNILRMVRCKAMDMWGAYEDGALTGMLAVRGGSHICLFYVDDACQKAGIGSALLEAMLAETALREVTVHAAPFAAAFYKKKGFTETDTLQCENGLLYTPMKLSI